MNPIYRENSSSNQCGSPKPLKKDRQMTSEIFLKKPGQTDQRKKANNLKQLNTEPSEAASSEAPKISSKHVKRNGSLNQVSIQKQSDKNLNSAKPLTHVKSADSVSKKPDETFLSADPSFQSKNEDKLCSRSLSKPPESFNEITTSPRSQEVLANKFIKEFQSCLQSDSDSIDFPNTLNLLKSLRFIQNDSASKKHEDELRQVQKLWKLINGEDTVKVQNLLCICLNIMNLYSPSGHLADSSATQVKSWSFLHDMFVYNSQEALKIHKVFYELYQNRTFAPRKQETGKEEKTGDFKNREAEKPRFGSTQKKEKQEGSKRDSILKTDPNDKSSKQEGLLKAEREDKRKHPFLLRTGSKKNLEVSVNSVKILAPKPDQKKMPLGIKKEIELISGFNSPNLKRLKTELCENQSLKSFRGLDISIKKLESKSDILHKKSCSFINENVPIQGINIEQSVDLANNDERSQFEDSSICSPKTSTLNYSENTFEENKESDSEDTPSETLPSSSESTEKFPTLKTNSHAAALELINYINDHNLSEDSAEKLLQIFKMAPRIMS